MKKLLIKTNNDIDDFIKHKFDKLHEWVRLPIGLGIITSVLYIVLYGFGNYFKNFLEWIIGATMIIIVVERLTRNGKTQ